MTSVTSAPTTFLAANLTVLGDRLHTDVDLAAFTDFGVLDATPSLPLEDPNPATALPLHILAPRSAAWLKDAIGLAVRSPAGIQPHAIVVFESPEHAASMLADCDLTDVLKLPYVTVIAASNPTRAIADFWAARPDVLIGTRCVIPSATSLTSVRAALTAICIREANDLQQLTRHFVGLAAQRPRAFWHKRFEDIRSNQGRPLRAVIFTSRFTTFLQHSARDLADAIERAGGKARVSMEPDNFSVASPIADLRTIADFDPDVIIGINVTRSMIPAMVPKGIPMVTWIQDALPKLFDRKIGLAMGELDFVIGHLYAELFDCFMYPRARSMSTPVLVSPSKFHAGPVDDARRSRFTCDVAYLSHQSETPEACRDRLTQLLAPTNPQVVPRLISALFEPLARAVDSITHEHIEQSLSRAVDEAFTMVTRKPAGPQETSWLRHGVAEPIAERMLRHQMASWAAEICTRRGWTMKLFGKGWDKHPALAHLAAGEVDHGEDLRACYQCASVHLHAGLGGAHQRLYECVLSGGCPLVRLKHSDLDYMECYAQFIVTQQLLNTGAPFPATCPIDNHPQAARFRDAMRSLQLPWPSLLDGNSLRTSQRHADWLAARPNEPLPLTEHDAWYMGDPALTGFTSRASLEGRLEALLSSPAARNLACSPIHDVAVRSATIDRLRTGVVNLIADNTGPRPR